VHVAPPFEDQEEPRVNAPRVPLAHASSHDLDAGDVPETAPVGHTRSRSLPGSYVRASMKAGPGPRVAAHLLVANLGACGVDPKPPARRPDPGAPIVADAVAGRARWLSV
jgi:hypothetical protein